MFNLIATLVLGLALIGLPSQPPADVAGTWNISLQGHQIALVLEQQDAAVTGTLMLMNVDVPVTGTFKSAALSLSGSSDQDASGHLNGKVSVDATLGEDGILSGTLATPRGKLEFKAERLKRRPKH
jgi:hypothetical protein